MLFQGAIAGAVMMSNAYWHWTPNNVLAAVLGGCAAWLVTAIITDVRDRMAKYRIAAEQRERHLEGPQPGHLERPADWQR